MSRKAIKWINGIGFKPAGERQREFLGGRLSIPTNEENIDKICDQLKQMASLFRDLDEEWMSIDILKNKEETTFMKQWDFVRSDWNPTDTLKDKVAKWESQHPEGTKPMPEPEQSDPFADEEDIPF